MGKTHSIALLKVFKNDMYGFVLNDQRIPRSRLIVETETEIARFG